MHHVCQVSTHTPDSFSLIYLLCNVCNSWPHTDPGYDVVFLNRSFLSLLVLHLQMKHLALHRLLSLQRQSRHIIFLCLFNSRLASLAFSTMSTNPHLLISIFCNVPNQMPSSLFAEFTQPHALSKLFLKFRPTFSDLFIPSSLCPAPIYLFLFLFRNISWLCFLQFFFKIYYVASLCSLFLHPTLCSKAHLMFYFHFRAPESKRYETFFSELGFGMCTSLPC